MRRYLIPAILLAAFLAASTTQAAPPIFKEKKYFGPIPYNSISISAGFLDGADFKNLTDHLNEWAVARHGVDNFEDISLGTYGRVSYERQLTPNHFLKLSGAFNYITQSSVGNYVASLNDTLNVPLNITRDFKVYLVSLEAGFNYYFVPPEPERFSPYAGAGFAGVIPITRLKTESRTEDGAPFSNPGEDVSHNSFQAGLHLEFGMSYFLSNRYAMALEGKYQMAQSKFDIHGGNFDLSYTGFILSLNLTYYL
jgi:opacity protein-like surface antigen